MFNTVGDAQKSLNLSPPKQIWAKGGDTRKALRQLNKSEFKRLNLSPLIARVVTRQVLNMKVNILIYIPLSPRHHT